MFRLQYAIVFKTPKYREEFISRPANVNMALFRPSDAELSEPIVFTYMPEDPGLFYFVGIDFHVDLTRCWEGGGVCLWVRVRDFFCFEVSSANQHDWQRKLITAAFWTSVVIETDQLILCQMPVSCRLFCMFILCFLCPTDPDRIEEKRKRKGDWLNRVMPSSGEYIH